MSLKQLFFSSVLCLASTVAVAQTASKPSAPPPGHDMNEQNTNAPGMREQMRSQDKTGAKSKPAPVTGHDMNEQNTLAPGMREQMRREQAKSGSAKSANPGHDMNEQNTLAPGMPAQMKKQ